MTDISMLLFLLVYTVTLVTMVKFMHHRIIMESNDRIDDQFDRDALMAMRNMHSRTGINRQQFQSSLYDDIQSDLDQVFHSETLYFLSRRV